MILLFGPNQIFKFVLAEFWFGPKSKIQNSASTNFEIWFGPKSKIQTSRNFEIWVVYFLTASHWQKVNSKFLLAENEFCEKIVTLESNFSFSTIIFFGNIALSTFDPP